MFLTPFCILRYGEAYVKQEEAAYAEQVRERLEKHLHRRAAELGYVLKKIEPRPEVQAAPPHEVEGRARRPSPVALEET